MQYQHSLQRSRVQRTIAVASAVVLSTGIFIASGQGTADAALVKTGCGKFVDDEGFAFFFATDQDVVNLTGTRCSQADINKAEVTLQVDFAPGKNGSGPAALSVNTDFDKSNDVVVNNVVVNNDNAANAGDVNADAANVANVAVDNNANANLDINDASLDDVVGGVPVTP